jgi:hypothetical protein
MKAVAGHMPFPNPTEQAGQTNSAARTTPVPPPAPAQPVKAPSKEKPVIVDGKNAAQTIAPAVGIPPINNDQILKK